MVNCAAGLQSAAADLDCRAQLMLSGAL